ncbi:MAG: Pyridoxine 5'-phosphate oxidase family protein containing flavin binding domain [Candidatus Methanohalarchaeum thermophilum]|uniref:Pyridoxine 5'-phosphate oxidase family protein containing flavin binding domain n=1 Tax=Methanohalarchaeum thermophilum TaxID=1903181 RepID=A0A1Q6DVR0_METT1|nr:MAG: Pyridoxine 5'-phosphate oxidase family protein containing flavin binding domain [Candidatus Methanohalarchaeum thermophilum]
MVEIPKKVQKLLEDPKTNIVLGTVDDDNTPNAVPMNHVWIEDKETISVGDVFFSKTERNLKSVDKAVISFWKGSEGYQIKAKFKEFRNSGDLFEEKKEIVEKKDLKLRKIGLLTAEEIYITSPGPEAGDRLI